MGRAMKDSGVAWLGEIPEGWAVGRVSMLCHKVSAGEPAPSVAEAMIDGMTPFVRVSDLSKNHGPTIETVRDGVPVGTVKIWPENTVVFPKSGESIRSGLRKKLGHGQAVVSHLACLVPKEKNDYLFWLSHSFSFEEELTQTSLPALGLGVISRKPVPIPPVHEQRAIAAYLERETAIIDQEIALIERKVALLAEYRKAVIFEAVTKGLDKNATMKDSGVAWIGEMPKGWSVSRVKNVVSLFSGRSRGVPFYVGMENVESATGRLLAGEDARTSDDGLDGSFEKGDVLFGKLRPYLKKSWIADRSGSCSTEFLVLRSERNFDNRFLFWNFLSEQFCSSVNDQCGGVKMPRADWGVLGNEILPHPSLSEQQAIAAYLERETALIDQEIALIERKAALLAEYRKALVFEAVTGKVEVPSL